MDTITTRQRGITFGLFDDSVEFVAYNDELKVVHGGAGKSFSETPEWAKDMLMEEMMGDKQAMKCLTEWEGLEVEKYLEQFTYCRYAGNDDRPDIDGDRRISHPEFVNCGRRSFCPFQGKLCKCMQTDKGTLTFSLIRVIENITLPDKLIADKLFKSKSTIDTQLTTIRQITGCRSKLEILEWAKDKGIL